MLHDCSTLVILACVFIVALACGLDDCMASRKERRLSRAKDRGYVNPCPKGFRQLLVPDELFERVRLQRDSLLLHLQCVKDAGLEHHYLADALRFSEHLHSNEIKAGLAFNKRAAAARHDWTACARGSSYDTSTKKYTLRLEELVKSDNSYGSEEILEEMELQGTSVFLFAGAAHSGLCNEFGHCAFQQSEGRHIHGQLHDGEFIADNDGHRDQIYMEDDLHAEATIDLSASCGLSMEAVGKGEPRFFEKAEKMLHDNGIAACGTSIAATSTEKIDKENEELFSFDEELEESQVDSDTARLGSLKSTNQRWVDVTDSDGEADSSVGAAADHQPELDTDNVHEKFDTQNGLHGFADLPDAGKVHENDPDPVRFGKGNLARELDDETDMAHDALHKKFDTHDALLHENFTDKVTVHAELHEKTVHDSPVPHREEAHPFEKFKVKPGVWMHTQIESIIAAPWRRHRNACQRYDLAAQDSQDSSPHSTIFEPPGQFDFSTRRGFGVKNLLDEHAADEADELHGNTLHGANDNEKLHDDDELVENLHEPKSITADTLHELHVHGNQGTPDRKIESLIGVSQLHEDETTLLEAHAEDSAPTNVVEQAEDVIVPFFVPCEIVNASISRSISCLLARNTLDILYTSRAKHDFDEVRAEEREFVFRRVAHASAMSKNACLWKEECLKLRAFRKTALDEINTLEKEVAYRNQVCSDWEDYCNHLKAQIDNLRTVNASFIRQLHNKSENAEAHMNTKLEHDAQKTGKIPLFGNSGNSGKSENAERTNTSRENKTLEKTRKRNERGRNNTSRKTAETGLLGPTRNSGKTGEEQAERMEPSSMTPGCAENPSCVPLLGSSGQTPPAPIGPLQVRATPGCAENPSSAPIPGNSGPSNLLEPFTCAGNSTALLSAAPQPVVASPCAAMDTMNN